MKIYEVVQDKEYPKRLGLFLKRVDAEELANKDRTGSIEKYAQESVGTMSRAYGSHHKIPESELINMVHNGIVGYLADKPFIRELEVKD